MVAQRLRIFFIALIIASVFVICVIAGNSYKLYKLEKTGLVTTGKILQREKTRYNKTYRFLYTVNFTTAGGEQYTVLLNLGTNYKKIGQEIELMYNPANPAEAQLYDNGRGVSNAAKAIGVLTVFLLFFIWGWRNTNMLAERLTIR